MMLIRSIPCCRFRSDRSHDPRRHRVGRLLAGLERRERLPRGSPPPGRAARRAPAAGARPRPAPARPAALPPPRELAALLEIHRMPVEGRGQLVESLARSAPPSSAPGSPTACLSAAASRARSRAALPTLFRLTPWCPAAAGCASPSRMCSITSSSCASRSAPGRSALLITKTSAISISPAFIAWIESPDSGTSTTTVVSAVSAISSSDCPTPTVSVITRSKPKASSRSATSLLVVASPPSEPRVAMERMKTPGRWRCCSSGSGRPSSAPPVKGEEGSTGDDPDALLALRGTRRQLGGQRRLARARRAGDPDPLGAAEVGRGSRAAAPRTPAARSRRG
jgi:hypothetical protein